jgi:tRNA-binding protein
MNEPLRWEEFARTDIRVGRILTVSLNARAIKPAYRLTIDFGEEIGTRESSAQLTTHYAPGDLQGRLVVAVVNFPPKQIAGVQSEVLVLGVPDEHGAVILLLPERDVPLGGRMF